jgi:hypothetical protein
MGLRKKWAATKLIGPSLRQEHFPLLRRQNMRVEWAPLPDRFAALKLTQLSEARDHNFGGREHNKKWPNFSDS